MNHSLRLGYQGYQGYDRLEASFRLHCGRCMANKNGKRKVPKHKAGRTPKLQVEDEFELDNMSQTASLMSGLPSASKRNSHRTFAFGIGILVGLCLLIVVIAGVLAVNLKSAFDEKDNNNESPAELKKHNPAYGLSTDDVFLQHQASTLSSNALRRVANAVDEQDLKAEELNPLLIPRVSGTPGNEQARNHILNRLQSLGGWVIELDTFQERAPRPHGMKTFTNIVATANPATNRRLVLACHYDSKFFEPSGGQEFIGATDSALPCAQILYLARRLNDSLKQANNTNPPVTLQLIFFDGEEAFVRWTSADSIYGARHLADRMQATPHPPGAWNTNLLHGMDMFILLDLLGARNPSITNYFRSTTKWYNRLAEIENRLKRGRLTSRYNNPYFNGIQRFGGGIEDDHIPFLRKGVRILHLIPSPFPSVWHTMRDNAAALDDGTISNLSKILHVFIAEYLSLPV